MSQIPYVHLEAALAGLAAGARVALRDDERHHLATVLRLRDGAEVEVADGRGSSAPARLDGAAVALRAAPVTRPAPRPRLELAQALAKGRKLDEVVRQVTELGVDAVRPVSTARSVPQLDGPRQAKAQGRWAAVARAAAQQCRRPTLPRIEEPVELADLVASCAAHDVAGAASGEAGDAAAGEAGRTVLLVAEPAGTALPRVTAHLVDVSRIVLAIGPEGGWSDQERRTLLDAGARLVGLGPTVLRTEHAGAAAVAVLAATSGRWD